MTISPEEKKNTPQAETRPEAKDPKNEPPPQPSPNKKTDEGPATTPDNKRKRNKTLWIVTIILVIIALAWFLLWFFYLQYYESTDDAYANGNMININSAISGSVVAFYADDTDLVIEGQILAKLDTTSYQVVFDKELATLAATVLQVRQLYTNVNTSKANVELKKIALEKASYDYNNRSRLVESKAVSNEDFTHSKDDFHTAQFDHAQAESQLQAAKDAAGITGLVNHPLIEQQKGVIRQAYYNLQHCWIYAPATGYIAQRFANVGQWVSPNTPMMAVIPIDYVWVDANYKETQLSYMRIGQPATVELDIYPGVKYQGKVLGIASGSGSVFSLIPPQNATGNWIKIVQRLPVRISLDPETLKRYPIRLGLSAYANVDLTNQDLPLLAQVPSAKPIGKTDVFDIQMDDLEKLMKRIIEANMKRE